MIYWTLQEKDAQMKPEDVLSAEELESYRGFKFSKRREEWLLGRVAAKHLLHKSDAGYADLPLQSVSVRNEPEGAPFFVLNELGRLPGCLSISHSGGLALCGLTLEPGIHMGVDLERVEPRDPVFVEDFFTEGEEASLSAAPEKRDELVTLIWSAKEAVLKALGKGLRLDTRRVEIIPGQGQNKAGEWSRLEARVSGEESGSWTLLWQRSGEYVLTAAVRFAGQAVEAVQFIRVETD